MESSALTNRELASLLLIGAIALYATLGQRGAKARMAIGSVISLLLQPAILIVLGLYVAWILSSLIPASRIGLWDGGVWKTTILWLIFTGFGLIAGLSDAVHKPGYFRRALLRTVEIAALVGFFAGLRSFPLLVEVPAQALAFLMTGVSVVAREPEHRQVRSLANGYLVTFGVTAVVWSTVSLLSELDEVDGAGLAREFLLPIWITPVSLAFVYGFAVYDAQRTTWRLLRLHQRDGPIWGQRLAVLLRCNVRLGALRSVRGISLTTVARSGGFRPAWTEITRARKRQRAEAVEAARAAKRLVDNAGLEGTDDDGHQLDQREFVETRGALRWLSTCQMGQYRNNGGSYRRDIVNIAEFTFTQDGLPEEHGVEACVSDDGQRWYGWRQTPSGWWLAIGAAGPPPDQWLYDGPEPPSSFPTDERWDHFEPGAHSANWD
jgi:hypothetical protein